MGAKYPDYPPSLADLNDFRTKIPDPAVYTWVQTGSDQWSRLVDIGAIYRNSVKGKAFEARREPGVPDGESSEYFHMCRVGPCTFPGGRNSQNPIKGRPIVHITRVA